jgi:hypothetical protein
MLRFYLAEFQAEGQSANETLFSADCGVHRRLPGGMVTRGKLALYWGTTLIYGGVLYEEMAARLISWVRDNADFPSNEFVRLRAGAVAFDGRALLMPTIPERHLPALVGLLVRAGAGFLGSELAHLDPVFRRAHPVAWPLMVDGEDIAHFPELNRESPRRRQPEQRDEFARAITPRRPVSVEEVGGTLAGPTPVRWLVFPEFETGEETRLEATSGSEILFRFVASGLNLHVWEDRALTLMRDILDTTPVSRLVVGSLPEAADLLVRTAPSLTED